MGRSISMGTLIIASECTEGVGSKEYAEAQRRLIEKGVDGFFDDISRKDFADIDEWQTQMQLKTMRVGAIHLYTTGLSAADRQLTGVSITNSIDETVRRCVQSNIEQGGDSAVAVIPEGPYVVPAYRPLA